MINTQDTTQHYQDAKCSAIRNADVFMDGYSQSEAQLAKKEWVGVKLIAVHVQNVKIQYSRKEYLDPLVNFMADSQSWLSLSLYNVGNSLDICYVMNKALTVVNPAISASALPQVAPILISNLGSSTRKDTYSYKIMKEFNEIYRKLGDEIIAMRSASEYIGREHKKIEQALEEKVSQTEQLESLFDRQVTRMHTFIYDNMESKASFYSFMYQFTCVLIIISCSCQIVLWVILRKKNYQSSKSRIAVKVVRVVVQLAVLIGLFVAMISGVMVHATMNTCNHLNQISTDRELYNNSHLFTPDELSDRLASAWYDPSYAFYQPSLVTNLTQSFQNISNSLIVISNMSLPTPQGTYYQQFLQQVSDTIHDPTMAFESYPNSLASSPLLQINYLNSIVSSLVSYDGTQIQSTSCASVSFKDHYVNNQNECPAGSTVYNLWASGVNTGEHAGQSTCIILQSCTQLKSNAATRYSTLSSCSAPSLLITESGATYQEQTLSLIEHLCLFRESVVTQIGQLKQQTDHFGTEYSSLHSQLSALQSSLVSGPSSYNTTLSPLFSLATDPEDGLLHMADSRVLQYSMNAFHQSFCSGFMVSFTDTYFVYLLVLFLSFCYSVHSYQLLCLIQQEYPLLKSGGEQVQEGMDNEHTSMTSFNMTSQHSRVKQSQLQENDEIKEGSVQMTQSLEAL